MDDDRRKSINAGVTALNIGPRYQCDNCETIFTDKDEDEERHDYDDKPRGWRHYIHHLQDRVGPGEPMPAGQCNICGSLIHLMENKDG